MRRRITIGLSIMAALVVQAGTLPAAPLVVEAGTVLTMTGEVHSPGVVIVDRGRIRAVGDPDEMRIPHHAERISAPEGVLLPAFVEAHSQRGMPRPNENLPNAAFITAADNLDPVAASIEDARRAGIATLLVIPGNDTVFGGRGLVVEPVGIAVEEMVRIGERGLKISLAPRPGHTRMEQRARLRRSLEETRAWLEDHEEEAAADRPRQETSELPWEEPGADAPAPGTDPRRRALADLLEGRLIAIAWCETPGDVAAAYELADAFEIDLVPLLGPATWRAADLLAERGATVIVGPEQLHWERDPDGRVSEHSLPFELYRAGVPFALTTEPSHFAAHAPLRQAALAVRHGVPRETALEAWTTVPARLVGMAEKLGTLEPGREATMVLLSGDPFGAETWVDRLWIEGREVYDRSSDEKLRRMLRPRVDGASKPPAENGAVEGGTGRRGGRR